MQARVLAQFWQWSREDMHRSWLCGFERAKMRTLYGPQPPLMYRVACGHGMNRLPCCLRVRRLLCYQCVKHMLLA